MTLQHHTDTYWFPDGAPAANVGVAVFPKGSSALAALWTDASGTVALPNPLTTNGVGLLDFWAESGEYWIYINAETIPATVGMGQQDATLSTGIASGGEISANASNPSAVDIAALDGYIVDFIAGDQSRPVVTRVKAPSQTVPMDAGALARAVTYWLMDSAGNVIQQAARPGPEQRRTHLMLGVTGHTGGVIGVDQTIPVILADPANQLADLMDALGAFSISGNVISPNGANLQINQTAGRMFSRGFNHFTSGVLTRNPHISDTVAQTPASFIQITRSTVLAPSLTSTLDVANYDNAGVVAPVGGGAGSAQIIRVYCFANNLPPFQLVVQYGQTVHSSLSAALDRVGKSTSFIPNPTFNIGQGALVAYIAVTRSATNLSDPAQAVFVPAGKFAAP